MPYGIPSPDVNPDLRLLLARRIRDEVQSVPRVHVVEKAVTPGEDRAMHRGPEPVGAAHGKWRRTLHRLLLVRVQRAEALAILGTLTGQGNGLSDIRCVATGILIMKPIYLDYAATTPVREEVREAMGPLLSEEFGNPSSRHRWGRAANAKLEEARERSAAALGVAPTEVLFIRGGTESDNLAILGRAAVWSARGKEPLVVVSAVEHKAVMEAAESVARSGGECVVLDVGRDGTFDEDALRTALDRQPAVVSMMWVNNEVGLMFPVVEVAEMVHAAGSVFHTDAVQAVGKVPVCLGETEIDLATVTGHKIYGPKGTGLLVVRRGTEIAPRVFGGGQEQSLRPGTEDVAGAVGMSVAVELATREAECEAERLTTLRKQLEESLVAELGPITVHGAEAKRAPHILSIGIPQADQDVMLAGLDLEGIAVSGGSACDSGAVVTSHVLLAMYGEDARGATIRFSLGRGTTADHIHAATTATVSVVRRAEATASL